MSSIDANTYQDNMSLWDMVSVTNPSFQKEVTYGKRRFTAVDPQWQLEQATKIWGPYGDKWGLRNLKHEIVRTDGVGTDGPYVEYAVVLQAEFYYPKDGKEVSFPILNDDKFKIGQDCFKKLVTNTRSKALSWLGFSADVFMGKFDDVNYVKDLKMRFGDQDALTKTVLAAVRSASNKSALDKCKARLLQMIADKTIGDPVMAAELMAEVAEREEEFAD